MKQKAFVFTVHDYSQNQKCQWCDKIMYFKWEINIHAAAKCINSRDTFSVAERQNARCCH